MKYLKLPTRIFFICCLLSCSLPESYGQDENARSMQYTSRSPEAAVLWQNDLRSKLQHLLNLEDLWLQKNQISLNPKDISTADSGAYRIHEVEFNSTPGRRIKVVLTIPSDAQGPVPAVLCIHGHGGTERIVYDRGSLYHGFAAELARRNYVTIAGFVSQHEVYEEGMLLMGERLWDMIRCVDYLETLDVVDKNRIGCAGLSLGGEMAMWMAAMDTRMKATVSAGFLTTMDHMETGHCMCWKFPGLRELVDYADIYSLTAPRALVCQNGLKEPVSQFYVPIAREALKEIELIYKDLGVAEQVSLNVHNGAHIMNVENLILFFEKHLQASGIPVDVKN